MGLHPKPWHCHATATYLGAAMAVIGIAMYQSLWQMPWYQPWQCGTAMAYVMTVYHGTCHGTAIVRHMDVLPWAVAAGLSLHCFHQSPLVLMAMDTMTPYDCCHDNAIALLWASVDQHGATMGFDRP